MAFRPNLSSKLSQLDAGNLIDPIFGKHASIIDPMLGSILVLASTCPIA